MPNEVIESKRVKGAERVDRLSSVCDQTCWPLAARVQKTDGKRV